MANIQPNPDPNSPPYWCYHCDKRVQVQTRPDLPDVICIDCNNGFVEPISESDPDPEQNPDPEMETVTDSVFGNQFLNVIRRLASSARENQELPNESIPNIDDDDEDENGDDGRYSFGIENVGEERGDGGDEDEEERRSRLVVEAIRRTLMGEDEGMGFGAGTGQERILNWAEILMELEDDSVDVSLEDSYIGNPEDYVDAAGYEALLHNLVENDSGGRGGAPPASRKAVEGLETVVIENGEGVFLCAVCKELVVVGEDAKKLGCGHLYHGDCIVPWLGTRNSCPICRFELPTDDPEYEEERKKKGNCGKGGSSSGVGVGGGDGVR